MNNFILPVIPAPVEIPLDQSVIILPTQIVESESKEDNYENNEPFCKCNTGQECCKTSCVVFLFILSIVMLMCFSPLLFYSVYSKYGKKSAKVSQEPASKQV